MNPEAYKSTRVRVNKLEKAHKKFLEKLIILLQNAFDNLTKINELNVSRIFVWGPDAHLINYNCKIRGYNANKRLELTEKFIDISDSVSKEQELTKKASQHAMCNIMNIQEIGQAHDAKSDAYNLSQVFRHYCGRPLPIVVN